MGEGNPVDRVRIRIKLGADEFEAEGPDAVVTDHFHTWQRLRSGAASPAVGGANGAGRRDGAGADQFALAVADPFTLNIERRLVTLQAAPGQTLAHADAALLLLYGFHRRLGIDGHAVLVTRLKAALAASGFPVARVDRMLAGHVDAGLIRKRGRRIGSTYELTDGGFRHADVLLHQLAAASAPR